MNYPDLADDDVGEFAPLKTLDVLAAFIHKKFGEAFLRQAFAMVTYDRESLEDAADKLAEKSLSHVAAIMADIAENSPSGIDLNPHEEGSTIWRYWRRRWIQKRRLATGELEESLRRRKATKH
jgi:hypothetical protein